jgi:predicted nuclease of predicted toxin-antitoxin system
MSLKILVDMNLSPDWVNWFDRNNWHAVHWSKIGDPKATDEVILAWARSNDYIVFTHDLDFGTLLALTKAEGPSVIQVRTQDVFMDHLGAIISAALHQYEDILEQGALVVVDERTMRTRLLPLKR